MSDVSLPDAPISDVPPGRYSPILVGHVWPSGSNLAAVRNASATFVDTAMAYRRLQDQLRRDRFGPLADLGGVTANDVRDAFQRGEYHAGNLAEKNEAKQAALVAAGDAAGELRAELSTIAKEGDDRIGRIQDCDDSFPAKIDRIAAVVVECQTRANARAATYGEDIFAAIQQVLDSQGVDKSARQLAEDHGIDTGHMFAAPNQQTARGHVSALLFQALR
jgi:hypothetical protein